MPFEERAAVLEEQVSCAAAVTEWTSPLTAATTHPCIRDKRRHRCSDDSHLDRRPRPAACGGWTHRDGWFRWSGPARLEAASSTSRGPAEVGRDLSNLQFEGRLEYSARDHDKIAEHARRWQAAGRATCPEHDARRPPDYGRTYCCVTEMAEVLL